MSTVTSGTLKDPVTLVTKSGKYGLPYYPLGEIEESHPLKKPSYLTGKESCDTRTPVD